MNTNQPDPSPLIAPSTGGIGVPPASRPPAPPGAESPPPDNPGEAALARFASLTRLLYELFEAAVSEVRGWLESKGEIDPWAASTMTRFLVRRGLARHQWSAENEEYLLDKVANIGLWLRVGNDNIRIWKAVNGGIPEPGDSENRIAYYSQQPLGFDSNDARNQDPHNYIIAWDVGPGFVFKGLLLALPRSATVKSVELMWPVVKVPHPALSIPPETTATEQAEDLEIDDGNADEKGTGTE